MVGRHRQTSRDSQLKGTILISFPRALFFFCLLLCARFCCFIHVVARKLCCNDDGHHCSLHRRIVCKLCFFFHCSVLMRLMVFFFFFRVFQMEFNCSAQLSASYIWWTKLLAAHCVVFGILQLLQLIGPNHRSILAVQSTTKKKYAFQTKTN